MRLRGCLTIALETLDQESEIAVNVHPSQLHSTLKTLEQLPHAEYLKIMPDDQIGIGDCRLEQNGQGLYATLDDQLEKVAIQINDSSYAEGRES